MVGTRARRRATARDEIGVLRSCLVLAAERQRNGTWMFLIEWQEDACGVAGRTEPPVQAVTLQDLGDQALDNWKLQLDPAQLLGPQPNYEKEFWHIRKVVRLGEGARFGQARVRWAKTGNWYEWPLEWLQVIDVPDAILQGHLRRCEPPTLRSWLDKNNPTRNVAIAEHLLFCRDFRSHTMPGLEVTWHLHGMRILDADDDEYLAFALEWKVYYDEYGSSAAWTEWLTLEQYAPRHKQLCEQFEVGSEDGEGDWEDSGASDAHWRRLI